MNITLNNESFRYDVHGLVKAFCPKEELNYNIISVNDPKFNISFTDESSLLVIIDEDLAKDRKEAKNVFKRQLYTILSEKTKRSLPWGTLTGIRPVKIPSKLLRQGKTDDEISSYMYDTYFVSEKKRNLAIEIAKNEYSLFERAFKDEELTDSVSLYVGIPFCPSICAYCSFSSYPFRVYENKVSDYLSALFKELKTIGDRLSKPVKTVYIGGGTPSTLNPEQLKQLCDIINSSFNLSKCYEFSCECGRPDSITEEKLKALKSGGVTRISINPQTMNRKTLKLIGRAHSPEDVEDAFEVASNIGFSSINCDLIAGLPEETGEEIKFTLNKIKKLNPDNVTVHSLAIKRAADINLNWEGFSSKLSEDDYRLFEDAVRDMGQSPYYLYRQKQIAGNFENVGYSTPGLECLYNCLIMGEYQDIIACGAGAVSKFLGSGKPERVKNVKDVDEYIKRIDELIERKATWL